MENIVPVNFRGVLQCGAYAACPAFASTREGIELAGCWAHARRHFHEAREHVPLRANWVLYQIQNLYRIEARLRESKAGPALRAAVRASQSAMILNRLKRALEKIEASKRHLPSSTFGKAISYTLSHWELLTKYIANGCIEIDNNGVENAIRPTAIGKKNWLFFGVSRSRPAQCRDLHDYRKLPAVNGMNFLACHAEQSSSRKRGASGCKNSKEHCCLLPHWR